MIEIIGDPGSCHMGRMDLAKKLIQVGAECGVDAVKFQLLEPAQLGSGNILFPWAWLAELQEYGAEQNVRVFASVFSTTGVAFLQTLRRPVSWIKFPYTQWELFKSLQSRLSSFTRVFASTDCMRPALSIAYESLYCIPEYPVPYLPNFEGLFPRFDGFSSHCLGILQDVGAIDAGARIIEKHYTLDDPAIACPDHQFAIRPHQLKELCDHAHRD